MEAVSEGIRHATGVRRRARIGGLLSYYYRVAAYRPQLNSTTQFSERLSTRQEFPDHMLLWTSSAAVSGLSLYDRFGHAGLGGAATGGFDPNAFSGFEDILGGLGDIFGFGDAFGWAPTKRSTARRRTPLRPRDFVRGSRKGHRSVAADPEAGDVRNLQGERRRTRHHAHDVPAMSVRAPVTRIGAQSP
jgi:hypothetical protein